MRSAALVSTSVLLVGCAGAVITGVRAPDPSYAKVVVEVEAHNLYEYRQPNYVQVLWAGYVAQAPVPVAGGAQPERFAVEVEDWTYQPQVANAPATRFEVRYLLGNRIIRRRYFPPPFPTPAVILDTIKKQREQKPPATAAGPPPAARPKGPVGLSPSLDAPTPHEYPRELVCELDAQSGPRYVRLERTPNKLVQLTIDVRSHGDPRTTGEVTWWSVELLDSKGRPLPHSEKEMVDVGGEFRDVVEWRFDGSPVIFKLTSGSDAGDTLRIKFEELE
ncbi:MAG: hypothetical protein D6731_20590 [Planctomycetota bacterium]|nr:MAG: hypothetical protein D6731_20590 [Planctomycetota bacterium]